LWRQSKKIQSKVQKAPDSPYLIKQCCMLSTAKILSRFYGLIAAAILFSPFVLVTEVQAQTVSPSSLPKDWCGRLWGVVSTGRIIWDNPINAASNTSPPQNVAPIPLLPPGAIPTGFDSAPGYATLAIHARSGTLYTIDRGSAILYQYNMGTGVGWTGTLLLNLPIANPSSNAANFNKMTVIGDTLLITNTASTIAYAYALEPATGVLASAASTAQTLTFDNNTLLPDGTRGNPPGTTNISGGDIAQDEYGDTYMLAYDLTSAAITPQYAYFYKLVGNQWIFKDRVQKATNTDQFAGLAFYNDTIYVKGTAGRLSRLALTRVGNDYDWAGNASALGVVGDSTGVSDLASCGVPALDVTKTQTIYTDRAGTLQAADQTKIVSGQYIRYTIVVANTGDAWARDSFLKDELPAGVTYVPNTATENGTNLNAVNYPFTNRVVTSAGATTGQIRLPFLGNSNTATYTYLAKVNGTAPNVRNIAEAGYLNPYPSDPVNCNTGLNCGRTTLLGLNPSILGTVWNDTNGSAANTFNNIFTSGEIGTNTNTALYALLVDSTGKIVASQAVASNGTYAFPGLNPSQTGLSIRLSTTAGTVGNAAPSASIPANWKNTSPIATTGTLDLATIDINNNDFGLSLPAGTILVKRITAINGQAINPYDGTVLNAIVNSTDTTNDDPTRKWPASYIKGAVNGGTIRPGDTVEYTVYYLNDSGADTKDLNICDPIRGKQTYVNGSMKMLSGGTITAISLTDTVDLTVDRASHYLAGAAPTNCNAGNSTALGRDNGGIAIQITGTGSSIQPDLTVIPAATDSSTPASSYGSFKFTTKIDPINTQGKQD
jgi:uncharacterized repeat protein (TIGR01451 family)